MARTRIHIPAHLPFSTDIPVRVTDINYSGHLGNDTFLSLLHEARLRFLAWLGYTELDVGGAGLIMADAAIVYLGEVFHPDTLRTDVGIDHLSNTSCDIVYRLWSGKDGREVAHAKTGMVFFDYTHRRVVRVPEAFRLRVREVCSPQEPT